MGNNNLWAKREGAERGAAGRPANTMMNDWFDGNDVRRARKEGHDEVRISAAKAAAGNKKRS